MNCFSAAPEDPGDHGDGRRPDAERLEIAGRAESDA